MPTGIEYLRQAERETLRLQQHVSANDTAALVRTWPSVIQAANEAWLSQPASPQFDDSTIERVALAAASLSRAADRHLWPGDGVPDRALANLASGLQRAAELPNPSIPQPEGVESQRLILSTVWIAARVVAVAARDASFDVQYDRSLAPERRQRTAQLARDTSRRISGAEHLAASALFRRTPDAPSGDPGGTVRHAIARWDIEAHRALIGQRSTATLHAVSFHQAQAATAFGEFIDAATAAGVINHWSQDRLNAALDLSKAAWRDVHEVAREFSFDTVPLPVRLHEAANQLRTNLKLPIQSADDHRDALIAISEHLSSSFEIATVARDLLTDGELRAPARAVARVISERFPDLQRSAVSPEHVRRGVTIPLPSEAREVLADAMTRAVDVTAEAIDRSASLDTAFRRRQVTQTPSEPLSTPVPTRATRPRNPSATRVQR